MRIRLSGCDYIASTFLGSFSNAAAKQDAVDKVPEGASEASMRLPLSQIGMQFVPDCDLMHSS